MEIYRCPITVAEGGKQLEIPLLSTCTAVRGTYSTASRVEWERGEEGRFNFCDANNFRPLRRDPGSGIDLQNRFSRDMGSRERFGKRRDVKKGGKKEKRKKKGGEKNRTFFILDRFVSTLRLTVRPAPLQIPSAFRFVQINQTFREQDSYARHA